MTPRAISSAPSDGIVHRLLSLPIFVKVVGIAGLIAMLFGGIALLVIHTSMSTLLYRMLEQDTVSAASSLAASIEHPLTTGDESGLRERLRNLMAGNRDVRYVLVHNEDGDLTASVFDRDLPTDIVDLEPRSAAAQDEVLLLETGKGKVLEVAMPIAGGHAGVLKLGMADASIRHEVTTFSRIIGWGVVLCASIGAGVSLLLARFLSRPLRHLVGATEKIADGQFATRATVYAHDEIGRLTVAFNTMAQKLQSRQEGIEEKEESRSTLIRQIVEAQEEERKSISRELHDQLGQSLMALLLTVQSDKRNDAATGSAIHDVEAHVRELIDVVHRLARHMRPSVLDDYGLEMAISRHVEEMREYSGLEIDYQYTRLDGNWRMPVEIELTLFRIVQESITNVLRHSCASEVSLVIIQGEDEVSLVVEDNGTGFDADLPGGVESTCLGVLGMRERAALVGGKTIVESRPGKGTTVRVSIPMREKRGTDSYLRG